ncbi:uncharacterized protein [Panulirus ornatus]|uniref:uncharacterized protein isoform X2 n=1 Tax=Panulirus ornatus TaxID=150431 RepID=UPI003A8C637B
MRLCGLLRVSLALACLLQVQGAMRETSPPPPVRPRDRRVVQELILTPHTNAPRGKHTPAQMSEAYPVSETSSDHNETNVNKTLKVKLPPLHCNDYRDCWQYTDPLLECRAGQCTCAPPFCWIYHYEASSIWTAKYVFQCGTCGVLGSSCNSSLACDFPGNCWSDGYCHCPRGENDNNICMMSNSNWIFKMALFGIGFILVFALCLTTWNCYKDPPWRRPEPWGCGFCPGNRGAERRSSNDKTPAFTIQAHYANQVYDGSTPSDQNPGVSPDEDVGGASATSSNRQRRSRTVSGGSSAGEDNSSFSSVTTTITNVSTTSTLPAADDPAPAAVSEPATGNPLAARSLRYQVFSLKVDAPPETTNFQTPSETGDSEDGSVAGSSGSCAHERCQLCLPKGPMTRPPSGGVAASPASAKRVQLPHLQSLDPVKGGISIESTNL